MWSAPVFKLQSKSVISGMALAACLAAPAAAQDRTALVIANSAYPGDAALPNLRGAALDVSEALLGLGFVVNRLENPSADDMQTALSAIQSATGPALVYYAGRTASEGDASFFAPVAGGDGVALDPLVTAPSDAPRFVFVDMCHDIELAEAEGEDDDDFLEGEGDDPNEVTPLAEALARTANETENLFFASSVEPGEGCEIGGNQTLTDLLLDRISVPGLEADQLIPVSDDPAVEDVIWSSSTLSDPFVFRPVTSDVRLTAEDYAFLETLSPAAQEQMIAVWKSAGTVVDVAGASDIAPLNLAPIASGNDTIVLIAPVRPVSAATVISPIVPRASGGGSTASSGTSSQATTGGVTVLAGATPAPAPAIFRATPGEDGLPAPSILVGFLTEDGEIVSDPEIVAPAIVDSPVSGDGLGYEDLEARNAMREADPDLFASLVETGAFDPPDAEMARAIQTELARMNCYKSTIDGIWGPGSRRSVTGYYEQVGGSTPSQDPDARIFRAIIASEDVRCPDPAPRVVAQPTRRTTTQAAPRRTTTQAAPRRQAAPAAPAPAPAAPARRTIQQSTSTGAFR